MAATDRYRRQHAELVEVVEQIKGLLDPATLSAGLPRLRSHLSSLFGKLSVHLAMEDNVLYPSLLTHASAEVRGMAKRFSGEMSSIKPAVDSFAQKWTDAKIRADVSAFCVELQKVLTALTDRIHRENTEFYAMVDRQT